jgi:hypothetical protein
LPSWTVFANSIIEANNNPEDPKRVLLEQAIPEVSYAIYGSRDTILAETARQLNVMAMVLDKLQSDYQMLANSQIQLTGRFLPPTSLTVHEDSSTASITVLDSTSTCLHAGLPAYTLVKARTVDEVWREWNEGILGGPAIKDLELKWGSKWRPLPKERVAFCRRKVIIDDILKRQQHGQSASDAITALELVRGDKSIDWLIKELKKRK